MSDPDSDRDLDPDSDRDTGPDRDFEPDLGIDADLDREIDPASWRLERKVGQLFVVGFDGPRPSEAIEDLVADPGVGGVIYFARNLEAPRQVAELSRSLQRTATDAGGPPLLVTVDEEGGIVSRLPWDGRLPGQMTAGATRDPDLARRAGAATARELRALGINANLAPVLDVNNNPDNPVIGVRSFGEDPELVSRLGAAAATGCQDAGVVACGKHFPGHGDTDVDSHLDLPVIRHDRARLDRIELAPFRAAIEADVGAIMTSHVAFPAIAEDSERPATLSENVLTGLLRDELDHDGLIVTDCMEMDAIAGSVGTAEGAVRAIEAGCDLVTVSHTPETQRAAIDAVVEAVRSERISEARIDRSVRRILRTKRAYAVGAPATAFDAWTGANDERRRVGRRIAERGVTLVRDRADRLPIRAETIRVLTSPRGRESQVETGDSGVGAIVESLERRGATVEAGTLDPETSPVDVDPDESVVVCTRDATADARQADAVVRLSERGIDLVVLAIRNPYDLSAFPAVSTYLTTYDDAPVSLDAAGAILVGDRDATGRLPVTIPGL